MPDYENKTLTVRLHALSASAAHHLTQLLNEAEIVFPESSLRLICETAAVSVCDK